LKEASPTLHSNFSEAPVSPRNANGVHAGREHNI
jgi:hypothetical protein